MPDTPTLTLNDGLPIPQLGFGVFQIPQDETERAVTTAQFAQAELREFHAAHGILTEAWGPIGQGKGLLENPHIVELDEADMATIAQLDTGRRLGPDPQIVDLR